MAHLLARDGAKGSIDEKFRAFLLYIAQSELREAIHFPENKPPFGSFPGPVVILDPVNSRNNVAAKNYAEPEVRWSKLPSAFRSFS